jgi:hypothetical protein
MPSFVVTYPAGLEDAPETYATFHDKEDGVEGDDTPIRLSGLVAGLFDAPQALARPLRGSGLPSSCGT